MDRWLEATKSSVRARTFERYAEIVRIHLKPGLGRHRLDALKPDHVQLFYSQKLVDGREREDGKPATGLSAQTVVHIHRVLHRALGQAVRWGYVVRNVTDMVDPPRVPRREMVVPTPEEVGRLLDAADAGGDRLAGLWATAALTGARQGELLGLQWGDVDLDAGTLQVRRSLRRARGGVPDYDEAKTTRSRRVVILTADAVAELRSHRDRQAFERQKLGEDYAPHNLVFTTPLGTPLDASNVGHRFKDAAKRANLRPEIRFHDLRHFAISAMLAAGIDVPAVSESVGHHSPAMTLGVYGHVMPGSKRKAAEKLSEVIRSARRGASG